MFAIWIIGFVYIYSSATVEGQADLPYAKVTLSDNEKYKMLYYLFGGLWCHALVGAFG